LQRIGSEAGRGIRLFSHTQFGLSFIIITFNDAQCLSRAAAGGREVAHGAHDPAARDDGLDADGAVERHRLRDAKPLAVVVIGGLISATLLTLIVLPTLYVMLDRRRDRNSGASDAVASVE
jgi:hypothetical protein